jgi:CheY-like chemotaxis protein
VLDAAEVVRRLGASTGRPLVSTYTSLDLNSLVDDTLALSRACWHDEAQVRGVAIHARFERGPIPAVTGDEAEVRELLLNLVLNAVDALAAGGELIVRTWAEAGRVVCAVTDTGGGMTAAVRRRATEPFFTTRGPGRRGLGLSVVAGILERHRGRLAIDSRVGHGTTVSFQLPAGDPLPAEFREAASPAVHGLRVLVVDDETSVRATIAEILIEAGHEAVEAVDGAEALACLTAANGDFDVVLTDLGMPGLTGWDVIDRVKARWPGLAVILVTGWGEHPRGRDGRHEPDAVLAKPVTERRLRAALSNAVRAGI